MIKRLHNLIWIFLLLYAMSGCKKKTDSIAVSADVRKYFCYKQGSYWIYRDSLSGETDSFAVTNSSTKAAQNNTYTEDVETSVVTVYNYIKPTDEYY
jgi:hypothetical protein